MRDVIASLTPQEDLRVPISYLTAVQKGTLLETLENSLLRSFKIVDSLFKEIERVYPYSAHESGASALLEQELSEEISYKVLLLPIWDVWKQVILRHNKDGEAGLFLHKILFYKNLQPQLIDHAG
ncbi:MAG: hypothetical protein LVR00_04470 [Rhabdochlamydiaceae bacterium]